MRGLKQVIDVRPKQPDIVASFMGAWVETRMDELKTSGKKVASFMGAWVETKYSISCNVCKRVASFMGAWVETVNTLSIKPLFKSHPLWVRGLKPQRYRGLRHPNHVASFMGAWVETMLIRMCCRKMKSHPLWVRGLKQFPGTQT